MNFQFSLVSKNLFLDGFSEIWYSSESNYAKKTKNIYKWYAFAIYTKVKAILEISLNFIFGTFTKNIYV